MEDFKYRTFDNNDYNGLYGSSITPHKVNVVGNYVEGDIVIPLPEFKSNIQLHYDGRGFKIVSAYSLYYLTNDTLKKLTFKVR